MSQLSQKLNDESVQKTNLGIRGMQVLVAEDNHGDAYLVKLWLSRLGCEVHIVTDGEEALQVCQHQSFDIILMDLDMPKLNGFEATLEVRNREKAGSSPRAGIVALTGNLEQGLESECLEGGMDAFLTKPVSPAALRSVLHDLFEGEPRRAF